MKKNMGSTDKIIRVLIAIFIAILYLTEAISGTLGLILLAFAITFLITSFVSFCPLYALLGIRSSKKKE